MDKKQIRHDKMGTVTTFENVDDWGVVIYKKRVLCLDYGNKRTGIAISDLDCSIATPLRVIETINIYSELLNVVKEYSIGVIVVGMPLALNGGDNGLQHKLVNNFSDKLQKFLKDFNIRIIQYDERLSSVVANRVLSEAEFTTRQRRKNVDKIAACFILQGFLDRVRYKIHGN